MSDSLFCIKGNTKEHIISTAKEYLSSDKIPEIHESTGNLTLSIVADSTQDLYKKLNKSLDLLKTNDSINDPSGIYFESSPFGFESVAFIFPGQGSQYSKMLSPMCKFLPGFRDELENLFSIFKIIDNRSMKRMIYADESIDAEKRLKDTLNGQPAIGIVSDALSSALMKAGIVPNFYAGHSYGELPALKASGVLDRKTFLYLSKERGRLLAEAGVKAPGCMTAVMSSADTVLPLFDDIKGVIEIANYNSPSQVVVTGETDAIAAFEEKCKSRPEEIRTVRLKTSCAFHSSLMSPAIRDWKEILLSIENSIGQSANNTNGKVYSNYTSEPYTDRKTDITENLYKQVENSVHWEKLCRNMYNDGARIFLETGPGAALTGLTKRIFGDKLHFSSTCDLKSEKQVIHLIAKLASHNIPINTALFSNSSLLNDIHKFKVVPKQIKKKESKKIYPLKENQNQNGASMTNNLVPNNFHLNRNDGGSSSAIASAYFEGNSNVVNSFFNLQENLLDKLQTSLPHDQLSSMIDNIMDKNMKVMDDFMQTQNYGVACFCSTEDTISSGSHLDTMGITSGTDDISIDSEQQNETAETISDSENNKAAKKIELMIEWTKNEICNITGFPEDIVTAEALFGNDLGLDSITLMQIIMGLIKEFPEVEKVGEKLRSAASLGSLHEILSSASVLSSPNASNISNDKKKPADTDNIQTVIKLSREVIIDVTGFPEEMVTMEADFTSDLGIDSITMIQIFMKIMKEHPEIEKIGEKMRTAGSLEALATIIKDSSIYSTNNSHDRTVTAKIETPELVKTDSFDREILSTDLSSWEDIKNWLLVKLSDITKKNPDTINADSHFSDDLDITIFEIEEIMAKLTEKVPEISLAGFELLRACTINELKKYLVRIIPDSQDDEIKVDYKKNTERFITVEQVEQNKSSYGDLKLPKRLILAGTPGTHADNFKRFLKDNECETILLHTIKKESDYGWEVTDKDKIVFFKFDEIKELSEYLEKLSELSDLPRNSIMPVLITDTLVDNLLDSDSFSLWEERMEFSATAIFVLAKALLGDKKETELKGELFAYINYGENHPSMRSTAGVLKSLSREWPGVNVKYARLKNLESINSQHGSDAGAKHINTDIKDIFVELYKSKDHGKEIIIDKEAMAKIIYRPKLLNKSKNKNLNINKNSILLLTGGGDGITSEIGFSLAEKYQCHIVSIGRTKPPEADSPYLVISDETQLKKRIYDDLSKRVAKHEKVNPTEMMKIFKTVKRQQAIKKNGQRIIDVGGNFSYFSADVTNKTELEKAIKEIKNSAGFINGFIHGAGIIEDKMVSTKTVKSFQNVLYTKAHSIYHLYHLLKDEPLEFAVLLSSVTSFTGTIGQTDYAAANEVLNGTAAYWNERSDYPVKSMLWSVWSDTGLANDALKTQMANEGLGTISTREGVGLFMDELFLGDKNESVVIFSPSSTLTYLDNYSGMQVA